MLDRDELIREVADHLVHQIQLIGPTPTVSERLRDNAIQAQETGEPTGKNWQKMLADKSRNDSKRGPRSSATLDHVVLEHLDYLDGLGIKPNLWAEKTDGSEIVAEAMVIARRELIDQGRKPGHARLPMTQRAVREIWDRRSKAKPGN
ncbi:hypothetical protein RB2150_15945 [Rhodobacterales bacterium HTCC2150]|nr:hypothetical protein RB2150_15945 [Rhodobacterales bacterium HTCC2150] [Rhodobacteraceae bacterium HTCC2150]